MQLFKNLIKTSVPTDQFKDNDFDEGKKVGNSLDYELIKKLQKEGKINQTRILKQNMGDGSELYTAEVFGTMKYSSDKEWWNARMFVFGGFELHKDKGTLEGEKLVLDRYFLETLKRVVLNSEVVGYP